MAFIGVARDDMAQLSIGTVGANQASTVITAFGRIPISITPASVAAASCVEQTFPCPGARVGDYIDITPPGITVGVVAVNARVPSANNVAISFINPTAGALVPFAGVYQIQVMR